MHFTVLSALPLPQDTSTAMNAVPVDDVVSFVAGKLLLENLASQKPVKMPEVDSAMIDSSRWECLVECMVDSLLAPYNENNTDIAHMEFDDHTDEGHTAYEQSGVDCVRTQDGRIITCHCYEFSRRYELHDGKVYRRSFGPLHHRKQTKKSKKYLALPNYPFQKLFPTFDAFMTEYWGYTAGEEDGRYGYYFNPNGRWDWWQIGGRWPFRFLVKDNCNAAVAGGASSLFRTEPQREAPDGYCWVAGARKCDIAWDVMREFIRNKCTEQFRQYEAWFKTGQIPTENAGSITLVKDGIISWGDYLYRKGETLEHRIHSMGLSDQHPYPLRLLPMWMRTAGAIRAGEQPTQTRMRFKPGSKRSPISLRSSQMMRFLSRWIAIPEGGISLTMDMEFDWKLQRMTTDAMMDIMIANENPRLSAAKCDALMEIKRRCCKYREIGFVPDLVLAVLEKKLELLKKADTIKDCKKIQAPSAPIYHQYSGDFRTDDPWVAEEELIQWSLSSLRTPLLPDVFKRFHDLFRQVFGVNI